MFPLFDNLRRNHKRSLATRRSRRKASRRRALSVEALEDRRVLSTLPFLNVVKPADSPLSATAGTADSQNVYSRLRVCAADYSTCGMTMPGDCGNVVQSALQSAASNASLLLTTEAATAELDHTAVIDRCFTDASDLLAETSAATGDDSFEPLPASFFEPGSEPFNGQVELGGGQTNTSDTIIERMDRQTLLLDGPPETLPIELISLSLVSCEPIPVPQSEGTMNVTRTHENGGTFESTLPVSPVFIFQPLAPNPAGGSSQEIFSDPFPGFRGGVSVAAGDVNADGFDDVIVVAGPGPIPLVNVFNDPVSVGDDAVFVDPTESGNGATAAENGAVQAQALPTLTGGALNRIDYLQKEIDRLRALRDQCHWWWDSKLIRYIDEQLDKDFEEIRQLQHGTWGD